MINGEEQVKERIIEEFSKTISLFGLTPLEARVYTYLYLSKKAETLDEMSEALGNSKTAIRTNIRSLGNVNLVKRVWKKGVRKDLYTANKQLYKAFMGFYVDKWMTEMSHQKTSLEEIRNHLIREDDKRKGMDQSNDIESELDNMIDFHRQLEETLNQVKKE